MSSDFAVGLWVVPNGGQVPVLFDAAEQFDHTSLTFFRMSAKK